VRRSLLLRQATNIGDCQYGDGFFSLARYLPDSQTTIFKRSDFDNEIPTPTPGNFPGVSQYTLTNYAIYPLDSRWNTKTAGSATPAPIAGTASGDLSYYYLATADVVIPTLATTTANLSNPNDPTTLSLASAAFSRSRLSLSGATPSSTPMAWEIHPGAL
jgi:hypothetical protein